MNTKKLIPKMRSKNPQNKQEKDQKRPFEVRYEKMNTKKLKTNEEQDSSQYASDVISQNQSQNQGQTSSRDDQQSQFSSKSQSSQQSQRPIPKQNLTQSPQNCLKYQPFATRQLFQIIIEHISQNIHISDRKSRLDYLLLEMRQKVPLKQIMSKFDKKDLAIIAQHKKLIEILDLNFYNILQKVEYCELKMLDYRKMILSIYDSLAIDVNLAIITKSIQRQASLASSKKVYPMITELINATKKSFETNNIRYTTQEDQLIFKAIQEKQNQKFTVDPFADFQLNKDHHYDHTSKYGIFSNKIEQGQLSKEGIFNYRLHRTMTILQKMETLNPQENIKAAKNIAIFLIKLTDHHIQQVVSKSMKIASIASRSQQDRLNQMTYFSKSKCSSNKIEIENSLFSSKEYPYSQIKVSCLKYPNQMRLYQNLRTLQMIEQSNLCNNLQQDISKHLFNKKKKLNKEERIAIEYFSKKPNAIQCINKIKSDTQKQADLKPKASNKNRIVVKSRHVKHFLQNHPYYKNHQIMWRFNIVY